ncbi:MAG: FAD-dependent thymidylate synthase [Candidatus Cloacimonetes bacterium]|nr:FAD-dependent thymidylate synthase [Candidatus Cloacimonadota bacterium]
MKVVIAGYNIDSSLLNLSSQHELSTPETISAAYARISRSPKSVDLLRKEALADVNKARKSNNSIVFEMGHASVAEHAVFNFDIIGISRLLVETVQRTRLASFTEKSQRYVTLTGDYHIPAEIIGTALESEFKEMIARQNLMYDELYHRSKKYLSEHDFPGSTRELNGKAKEDARYVLALATDTQFGMTINARSLERLLQRLDGNPLQEAKELKLLLETEAKKIAPSLVRYTSCEDLAARLQIDHFEPKTSAPDKSVHLLSITSQAEERILAGLLFENSGTDFSSALQWLLAMPASEKAALYAQLFSDLKPWQRLPRAFELVEAEFALTISSSCFGQLKRHRMATQLRSPYHPLYGYVIPPLLLEINVFPQIAELMEDVEHVYFKLEEHKKGLGSYILTNAHKLRVIFKANLRELYHFSRLRSDEHAQWEIREISLEIDSILKDKLPLAAEMLMGKDELIKKNRC